jgi:threonine synthase
MACAERAGRTETDVLAGWCTEEDTLATIKRIYDETGYLMDPHTAVAQCVYERYAEQTGDQTKTVLLSTAIRISLPATCSARLSLRAKTTLPTRIASKH